MKLNVHCLVGDDSFSQRIACGEGVKTFKWLGLTAAANFSARAPHGNRRSRDWALALASRAQLIPIDVCVSPEGTEYHADDVPFLHPDAIIRDFFKDGDTVVVKLGRSIPVNDSGHPKLPNWATIAFTVSEAQAPRRRAALAEEKRMAEAKRRERREALRAKRAKEEAHKAATMREVMRSKLQDETEVQRNFAEDWSAILRNSSFEKLCGSPAALQHVSEVLRLHYMDLCELFKTYAASSSGIGTAHELEQMEFNMMIRDFKVFHPRNQHLAQILAAIFEVATRGREVMDRASCFIGLIYVAWLKYIDGGHGPSVISRMMPREFIEEEFDPRLSMESALQRLMEFQIQPHMKATMYGSLVKNAINSDEVLAMFFDNMSRLNTQFLSYSSGASNATEKATMTLSEFGTLMERAGLLGSTQGDHDNELTYKEVRQAFTAAQGESDDSDLGSSHMQKMDFPEFIESIARVGCLKWEAGDMPVYDKVLQACTAVCEAPQHGPSRR